MIMPQVCEEINRRSDGIFGRSWKNYIADIITVAHYQNEALQYFAIFYNAYRISIKQRTGKLG
jgi:hypothetical protein